MSWLSRRAAAAREEHPLVLLGTSCALLAALVVGSLQRCWGMRHPGCPALPAGQPASGTAEPADR